MGGIAFRFLILHILMLLTLSFVGCRSVHPGSIATSNRFPIVDLGQDYDFSSKESITLYVIPSNRDNLDKTYLRVLQMDLQSRGYNIINANKLLRENTESVRANSFRQIVDSLMVKKYIPLSDVFIIARPIWERVYLDPDQMEKIFGEINPSKYKHMFVRKLFSYVAFFDKNRTEVIKSFAGNDTTRIYSEKGNEIQITMEYPWMIVARQLTKELQEIPICKHINQSPAAFQFRTKFWVDNSYRQTFPNTWKDRLNLRILLANDILRSQFNIELVVSEFKEWNSQFETELDSTLENIKSEANSNPDEFQIGITLDNTLKTNWLDKNKLGLAYLLGEQAAITAQPSFPEVGEFWNPIEEAITLVHEVGHLFGAIHVMDECSIMYPSAGFLSYEFDDANKKIIESTRNKFFNCEKEQRVKNYIQRLISIRNESGKNSIPVLPAIISAILNMYSQDSLKNFEYEKLDSLYTEIIDDKLYTLAVLGCLEYYYKQYEKAKAHFKNVIEYYPDFTEVHWYLSKTYLRMKERTRAERHHNIAKRNKNFSLFGDR